MLDIIALSNLKKASFRCIANIIKLFYENKCSISSIFLI